MSKRASQSPPQKVDKAKRSAVEEIKEASRGLRGTIAETLRQDVDHFEEADKQLLKFHGSYQQVDRDARKDRTGGKPTKKYIFMVRCKIPGGRLTAEQYLAVDELAGKYANGTLRITTRQGLQLHGVIMKGLAATIRGINECLLTTLGACGDVNRNVMICPLPIKNGIRAEIEALGKELAQHFAPRSGAYHEIWLDGKPLGDSPRSNGKNRKADEEPIYGKCYLPRKFKIGIALPENNLVDIYAQDLGLLAITENGGIVGYNILAGGGMGMTHGNPETFPYLAKPIAYVPADKAKQAAEAVLKLFRDHGNRANRKRARLKYVVYDWGVEKFREVLSGYFGQPLPPAKPVEIKEFDLGLGWREQGDGKYWYGVSVANGRIKDEGDFRLRTALRKIISKLRPSIRLTPMQDILLCDLDKDAQGFIERTLRKHGVRLPLELPMVETLSIACPAIPTCGLAISESERVMPQLVEAIDEELRRHGLADEPISVRMTGCPNGCARPYQSDIGIVGRSGTKYTIFVGGNVHGTRLNFLFQDLVPYEEIVPTLAPLFADFSKSREPGESFGDYCTRLGRERLNALLPESLRRPLPKHLRDNPADLSPQRVFQEPSSNGTAAKSECEAVESETIYSGAPGEERPARRFVYSERGQVVETIVYYYGDRQPAADAKPQDPLTLQVVYAGRVESESDKGPPLREIHFVGPNGFERQDRIVEYDSCGEVVRTIVVWYDGDHRASEAPPRAPLRREVAYRGKSDA